MTWLLAVLLVFIYATIGILMVIALRIMDLLYEMQNVLAVVLTYQQAQLQQENDIDLAVAATYKPNEDEG